MEDMSNHIRMFRCCNIEISKIETINMLVCKYYILKILLENAILHSNMRLVRVPKHPRPVSCPYCDKQSSTEVDAICLFYTFGAPLGPTNFILF